jgi:hypothetical protein
VAGVFTINASTAPIAKFVQNRKVSCRHKQLSSNTLLAEPAYCMKEAPQAPIHSNNWLGLSDRLVVGGKSEKRCARTRYGPDQIEFQKGTALGSVPFLFCHRAGPRWLGAFVCKTGHVAYN